MRLLLISFWKCIISDKVKVRFILMGIVNTAFGLSVYPTLYYSLARFNLHYLLILLISQAICVTFSYVTNKIYVFKTTGNFVNEYIKFSSFYLLTFLVNMTALPLMVEVLKMSPISGQILFTFFVVVLSFFWHSKISFSIK